MKKKGSRESLAMLALLLASASCILPPSKDDLNSEFGYSRRQAADGGLFNYSCYLWLTEISIQGEKYLDKQIENAIDGVKEMKSVMQKSSEDHRKFVDALEKTKQLKDVKKNKTNMT